MYNKVYTLKVINLIIMKWKILILAFISFFIVGNVGAQTLQENVDQCLRQVDLDYIEKNLSYKQYVLNYQKCYADNQAESLMPENLKIDYTNYDFSLAECQINASNLLNDEVKQCNDDLFLKFEVGELTLEQYTAQVQECSKGKLIDKYNGRVSACYTEKDMGWVWEIPALKQSLVDVYSDYQTLAPEKSMQLAECLEKISNENDLDVISADVQNKIAQCFNSVGLIGLGNVYKKTAITIDCAESSLGVESLNDARNLVFSASDEQKTVMEQCILKKTAPIITGIAVVNIPFVAGGMQTLIYFQFLFVQIFLLFRKKKGADFGKVYDSFTGRPIDLAVLRLFHRVKNKVVSTFVTGKHGKYLFLPEIGKYIVEVRRDGFSFPSNLVRKNSKEYFGGEFEIKTDVDVVGKDVPLDPEIKDVSVRKWNWKNRKYRFATGVAFLAPLYSVGSLIFVQKWWLVALLFVNLAMFFLYWRLGKKKKEPKFGVVRDRNGKVIKNVIVSLFEKKYNKRLAYAVTDSFGRYFFPAVAGEYLVVAEKKNYIIVKKDVVVSEKQVESMNIKVDVVMSKK
ncbi:hypothetical protein A2478_02475 [Candidatus Falkowbacteria bacterium RIFOXYC2_FULL_36_12]|uniref:Carboxypeptidase regulatory-like domain-containing protein n=1 Tax=Candidatus Falkowbacteria bacterium RIFOXYC2_FULL_36_12 TaxID=1798002 RepID=A0A1F5T3I2_9BACT|nr:MAG: hypothetical protein A2478_02475 [Candidatus Falkowbacteria bacterium RIFOXYC2_FULL_36_12]